MPRKMVATVVTVRITRTNRSGKSSDAETSAIAKLKLNAGKSNSDTTGPTTATKTRLRATRNGAVDRETGTWAMPRTRAVAVMSAQTSRIQRSAVSLRLRPLKRTWASKLGG